MDNIKKYRLAPESHYPAIPSDLVSPNVAVATKTPKCSRSRSAWNLLSVRVSRKGLQKVVGELQDDNSERRDRLVIVIVSGGFAGFGDVVGFISKTLNKEYQ